MVICVAEDKLRIPSGVLVLRSCCCKFSNVKFHVCKYTKTNSFSRGYGAGGVRVAGMTKLRHGEGGAG